MTAEVKRVDHGLVKVLANLAELKTLSLTIGFQGQTATASYPSGVNVATVAMFMEFGTIDAPARGFLRSTMFEKRGAIAAAFAKGLAPVAEGKREPVDALAGIGHDVAEMVRDKIDRAPAWAAPLAASTVRKKGHSRPLEETTLMRNSVTWAVRKGGAIVAEGI